MRTFTDGEAARLDVAVLHDHAVVENRRLALAEIGGVDALRVQEIDERIQDLLLEGLLVGVGIGALEVADVLAAGIGLPNTRPRPVVPTRRSVDRLAATAAGDVPD